MDTYITSLPYKLSWQDSVLYGQLYLWLSVDA